MLQKLYTLSKRHTKSENKQCAYVFYFLITLFQLFCGNMGRNTKNNKQNKYVCYISCKKYQPLPDRLLAKSLRFTGLPLPPQKKEQFGAAPPRSLGSFFGGQSLHRKTQRIPGLCRK